MCLTPENPTNQDQSPYHDLHSEDSNEGVK